MSATADSKETGPQYYYWKKLDSANSLNAAERRIFPEVLMRSLPAESLTWACETQNGEISRSNLGFSPNDKCNNKCVLL